MKRIFTITLLFIISHVDCAFSSFGVQKTDTISNYQFFYNSTPSKPLRVLFDYYHHSLPSTKVGNYITTGSWVDDKGRYGWDDFVHTNTFDPVYIALEKDYQISMGHIPFSKTLLSEIDIVVIINNEDPKKNPAANLIADEEISFLRNFVEEGGSLMVMLNAGSPQRTHEGFEKAQLKKLVTGFGLDWNDDDTHYSDNFIPEGHPYFYDIPNFHYGAGCTIEILPEAYNPEVLLNVYSDPSYTDRQVNGLGIVMVRHGKGKFMLVGDRGSWTGNMSRPWADNSRFLKQMFVYLHPDNGVIQPQYSVGQSLDYELTVSGLQSVPVANSLSEIEKPFYRMFSPRPTTDMPYFERSADLKLTCNKSTKESGSKMSIEIENFKWFDEQPEDTSRQNMTFTVSKQGKVSEIETSGFDAQWLSPDISLLVALLPADGIKPGDRWNTEESLRVPILRGSDLSPVKPLNFEVVYVKDTVIDGKECRLLRSSADVWLDDLGIEVDDLLPPEILRKVDGTNYRYFSEHGGKIMYKREQWVDSEVGIILKAKGQTRIVAWIHDTRKSVPAKNSDKDNEMIISLAHIVNYKLK